ncbi:MAG: ABC transporter permease, partial [Chthoniobacterales bacterium]
MLTDLKYAFRMLVKAPVFAVIAILTLALGIGANSAIFSVIDTVLLRPLPFKNPDEIVNIWGRYANDSGSVRGNVHSFPDYVDLRDQSQSFVAMAAYTRTGGTLSLSEDSKGLEGVAITPEVFEVLGVQPLLGRGFTREDAKNEADRVVVLTYPLWKSAFASDPKIIGQKITISARPHTVVGVMPPGWKFPIEDEHIDYALPLEYLGQQTLGNRGSHFLTVVGRLKPTVAIKRAEAELTAVATRLSKEYPDTNLNFVGTAVVSLHTDVVGEVRPALMVLLGAVALVLLIACANVANLLLARAAARSREIAIRTALGASRALVIRQLLCESLLIALLGGTAGLLLAWWGVDLLSAAGPQGLPHLGDIKVNPAVCLFTFVLAIGSTLLFGLIPALQVSRPDVNEALQQGAKGSTSGLHTNRLRAFLVVSQVSLSLLLLAGAALLIKSFFNLRATNPGFDPVRVMTFSINLP